MDRQERRREGGRKAKGGEKGRRTEGNQSWGSHLMFYFTD